MNFKSNCCNVDTRIGYYNSNENESDFVIALLGTFCTKCGKKCEVVNIKNVRRNKLNKLKKS